MHAKELMLKLLKIPSYSKKEKKMANFLSNEINKLGYNVKIEEEKVTNVIIDAGNDLLVATHMDTIERQMETKVDDNIVYGRGASDAKASIASILLFLEKAKQLNFSIAFLSDEEEDAKGSQFFVKKHKVKKAIIMEPTSLKICNYQAGNIEAIFEVNSEETHGSFCGSVIDKTIEMIEELRQMECWKKGKYFDSCMAIQEIKSINPYYLNPEKCTGRIEIRLLAEQNAETIAKEMKKIMERYGKVEFKEMWNGFKLNENDILVELARKACKKAGLPFILDGMPSWTDAVVFNKNGIKCIIFGPGELRYAHTKNENVNVHEVKKAMEFLVALNDMLT